MNEALGGGAEMAGRVCVVTGGGAGLGASIAETFAGEGADVAILDRDQVAGEAARARLDGRSGRVRFYDADVADESSVVRAAQRVAAEFGRVDVLVNNAGISRLGPSMSFSLREWDESMGVMATGVFLCSREFGAVIRAGGGGAVVNISSINGLVAFPMRLAYSAAKAAVVSMTKVLAVEWAGYGIRVNAVAPGCTRTDMLEQAVAEGFIDVDAYLDHTPLGRFGEPEDVAQAVLFLASDRSRYVTGQVLAPDGGWTAFGWVPWSRDPERPELGGNRPPAR
jgi:NAD(P)-dependent dehydrogenase (short-subunit alcohol dehydrogenase family)